MKISKKIINILIVVAICIFFFFSGLLWNLYWNINTYLYLKDLPESCSIQEPSDDRCEAVNLGAEFNKKENTCKSVSWGCSAPPFKTLTDCKNTCE